MHLEAIRELDEDSLLEEAYTIGKRVWGRILQNGPLTLPGL
jgi:hypothetical protein|tara:strand:- start:1692 stop:1814 length:123 start_codon:yes stop_codon:yes gene_type:complete